MVISGMLDKRTSELGRNSMQMGGTRDGKGKQQGFAVTRPLRGMGRGSTEERVVPICQLAEIDGKRGIGQVPDGRRSPDKQVKNR
jgi:hypothetical protein